MLLSSAQPPLSYEASIRQNVYTARNHNEFLATHFCCFGLSGYNVRSPDKPTQRLVNFCKLSARKRRPSLWLVYVCRIAAELRREDRELALSEAQARDGEFASLVSRLLGELLVLCLMR